LRSLYEQLRMNDPVFAGVRALDYPDTTKHRTSCLPPLQNFQRRTDLAGPNRPRYMASEDFLFAEFFWDVMIDIIGTGK
jgi:hypothetical protein